MKYILKEAPVKQYMEIGQQKKIKFSFCNKEGNVLKQLFSPVLCRDFLSDVLIAEERNKKVSQYSFIYDPAKCKIDRDKTRLLLNINSEDIDNLMNNLSILNSIEQNNKLVKTKVTYIADDVYLVEGSKIWLNSTFSLHLYTFLLKAISYEYIENWWEELKERATNEGHYAKVVISNFLDIINTKIKQVFKKNTTVHGYEDEDTDIPFLHNNGGVVTLFSKNAINYNVTKNNAYYKQLTKYL